MESYLPKRCQTRRIYKGHVPVGDGAPVSIQSMTNTDTRDVDATVKQINKLSSAGCEIIRVAVPDEEAAKQLGKIKAKINIPLVADIHFDYRLALIAIEEGVDALRINPGNIGERLRVEEVVKKAHEHKISIRIGVNAGSLDKDLLEKYDGATPEAMVESAARHVKILEDLNFYDIVISLKASDVIRTVRAYELASKRFPYPLHIGVTEAGGPGAGTVKSAIGIGGLLLKGIGDTIRVSLTGDPIEEVKVGWQILKSLRLRERGPEIISCPTCGRCEINLVEIARQVEERIQHIKTPLKIAVMGCAVNGPGEAREADLGLAGGRGMGIIFKHGQIIKKVNEDQLIEEFFKEIAQLEELEVEEQ
ncbi:MAG: flavodoxin-dependent (E)-4-hydroxy-3-methylbut-2-enyl-diphosphate synthase [Halanaerobiales bacterium]|nr:flavodoxin-dependent (E)-4-hydroxy-3-methylbut-2-enyl-diphosphate synthase [Halanaerobiales bacterium]